MPEVNNSTRHAFYMSCVVDALAMHVMQGLQHHHYSARSGGHCSLNWRGIWGNRFDIVCQAVLYKLIKIHAELFAHGVDTHEDLGLPGTVIGPVPVEDLFGLYEFPQCLFACVVVAAAAAAAVVVDIVLTIQINRLSILL